MYLSTSQGMSVAGPSVTSSAPASSSTRAPTRSSHNIAGKKRSTPWELKMEQRKKQQEVKDMERRMKEEVENARAAKGQAIRERRQKAAEKARLETMATRMSQKKLDRKRRRLGITKKVSH
ncbi:Cgr1 [Ceraceosorus bombacis]|uniref:rRNA-processing protein n=1 Tax=Ceraceosorus bombacis TaxID=401625 RepID=A0A0P1BHX2_9BASI|nr:Cgr1 [Ceraceosorus bombacis]